MQHTTGQILHYTHFHLVGIKGVAMTSIAQILQDMGKKVTGTDLVEHFVTQPLLDAHGFEITHDFTQAPPTQTECVIYTSAHQGVDNPQVVIAKQHNLPIFSQAEALAACFNQKKGVAVCGVGGKSTVSAMIAWILTKLEKNPSFSVGVGKINGLTATGYWDDSSEHFIAEADEYVTDPAARKKGIPITPRFSYLHPFVTVCTNLSFDHPDVYDDFEHTKEVFFRFFSQVNPEGALVINYEDLVHKPKTTAKKILTFGKNSAADIAYAYDPSKQVAGKTTATVSHDGSEYSLELQVPGEYNVSNACAAIAACTCIGIPVAQSVGALASFRSTKRRFEHALTLNQVTCYDDYAHHPQEVAAAITAITTWYPDRKIIVAFQPHTYSRTKQLLHEFVHSLSKAKEVWLLDIFASAREGSDSSISSDHIVSGVQKKDSSVVIQNIHSIAALAEKIQEVSDREPTIVLTLGAGDIYTVYDLLQQKSQPSLLEKLSTEFPALTFEPEKPLAQYTTVKIGGPAEVFTQMQKTEDLMAVAKYMRAHNLPITILGWGANTLIADRGIRGLVVRNMAQNITVLEKYDTTEQVKKQIEPLLHADAETGNFTYSFADLDYDESDAPPIFVSLDSGVSLPMAINMLIQQGITGLQWFSRIPATVGGAIYNNIHGGTHFISEFLESVTVLTPEGIVETHTHETLDFGYDTSRFHNSNEIILSAVFKLYAGDAQKAAAVAQEWAKRKAIQPQRSLGCIFQNITTQQQEKLKFPTTSVGYIVDKVLDKKGSIIGNVRISPAHAAFLENTGGASAAEYLAVIKDIIAQTKQKLDIVLKPEIFFMGFSHQELEGVTWHSTKIARKT